MRTLSVPSGSAGAGTGVGSFDPYRSQGQQGQVQGQGASHLHASQGRGIGLSDFCAICEQEEQSMDATQRRQHEQHSGGHRMEHEYMQQHQQRAPAYTSGYGTYEAPQPQPQQQQQHHQSGYQAPPPLSSSFRAPRSTSPPRGTPLMPPPMPHAPADESLLYSAQPSRAVLSALRTLQDKLQELRVEKSSLENALASQAQQSAAREHELQRQHERSMAEQVRKAAEFESGYLQKLREGREEAERAQAQVMRLENEVRMLKEQALSRDSDVKTVREEMHQLRMQAHELELNIAKVQGEKSALVRELESEKAALSERDLEVARLRSEVAQRQSNAQRDAAADEANQRTITALEAAREGAERNADGLHDTVQRLAQDLKIVSHELLVEREAKSALLQYKYLTREYVSSLLNLNYELCIDVAMPVKKRNDILQHSQQLLTGLKKAAWSMEYEGMPASADSAAASGSNGAAAATSHPLHLNGPSSPPRRSGGVTIQGIPTGIDEQKYLLAGASSPEAIRVLHPGRSRVPRVGGRGGDSETEEEGEEDFGAGTSRGRSRPSSRPASRSASSVRVSAAPTVASTAKVRQAVAPRGGSTPGSVHHHTLNKDIALPFTVGKSAKASFSIPVNVQEILSRQPAYYTRLAQRQVAQARKRGSGGGVGGGDDERMVYPPPPAQGLSFSHTDFPSLDADSTPPAPVSLSTHSGGLRTVITHLENEVEALNRDYVFELDHARRDKDEEKHALEKKLQSILKSIDVKTKQIDALKQHQESVEGSHGVRLHTASTASSRSGRAATVASSSSSSHKASAPHTLVAPAARRRSSLSRSRPSTAAATAAPSGRASQRRPGSAAAPSSTDLTDRHAHHQHGTQSTPTRAPRVSFNLDGEEDGAALAPLPQFGFLSPNSQRLLQKKMQSMRLLGQFKAMFSDGEHDGEGGDAAKRFGSD